MKNKNKNKISFNNNQINYIEEVDLANNEIIFEVHLINGDVIRMESDALMITFNDNFKTAKEK